MNNKYKILILNLPGPVVKAGSRWYNTTKTESASLRYYPYPWFMGYVTSLLKKNGFHAVLKDAVAMEWSFRQTIDYVKKYKPTHIICEPTWVSIEDDKKLLDSLDRKIVKIAVGNYATNYPSECLEQTGVDIVVIGEYEFSILEFFQKYGKKIPVNFIDRNKKEYQYYPLAENLDLFPFPERKDTFWRYYNEPSCYGKNIVMVSSRGCRLKCDFCNVEGIYGCHSYRMRSPKNVVDEIEYLKDNFDFDEIYFDDDNMVAKKEHVDGICKEIIKRKLKVKFLCMGDGLVDDETLGLLAKAGCSTYKFGLEHLDIEVLRAIPKPLNPKRSLEIIKKCRNLGMRSYTNLIIGLPKSTKEKDLKMLKKVYNAGPDLIQIGIATPYPGTTFYKKSRENKWLLSDDMRKFDVTGESAVSYPNYSAAEIKEVFDTGWNMWYKHVLFSQPKTLWFFFASEVRRNGLVNTIKKSFAYLSKIIRK